MSNERHSHYKHLGRELATQFLFQYDFSGGEFTSADLEVFLERASRGGENPIGTDERRIRRASKYAVKLVGEVMERLDEIDATVKRFLSKDWSWERIAAIDKAILRVAVCELLFFDDVPTLVSINEAVEIAKEFGAESSKAFINGLLDALKDNPVQAEG